MRLDHLALVGQNTSGLKPSFPDQGATPSLQPGVVVNLNEVPWTPITDPDTTKPYRRGTAQSRLIWGRNAQVSFVRMDPGSVIPLHRHPEDQLTHTIRGSLDQGVMDGSFPSSGDANNIVFLPGGMVHSAHLGEVGADQLDVFWPVRPDYVERAEKQRALYEQIIAPGVTPRKLADGFTFGEGPTWLKGTLYFSDMFFQNPAAGDWTGSPARSRLIAMTPDGQSRVLARGMQTNGTIAAANGNLLVCDMFGHRVIEVDPATGRVVRVVLDKVDGKRIDGPNDLVMDAKGGFYVTDPQFTPDAQKSQPGKQVYYVAPDGTRDGGDRSGPVRDAERRRAVAGRQDAVRRQHVGAARRELRVGLRRRRRRIAVEQAAVCDAESHARGPGRGEAGRSIRFGGRRDGGGHRRPAVRRDPQRRSDLPA